MRFARLTGQGWPSPRRRSWAVLRDHGEASLNGKKSNIWVQLDQWGPSNGFVTELALQNGHAGMPHC